MKYFLTIAPLVLLLSCKPKPEEIPSNVMDVKRFAQVMVDVQLLEAYRTTEVRRSTGTIDLTRERYEQIFRKHSIDGASFEQSFSYYQKNPELMEKIFEIVLDSLNAIDARTKQEYQEFKKYETDSIRLRSEQIRDSLQLRRILK